MSEKVYAVIWPVLDITYLNVILSVFGQLFKRDKESKFIKFCPSCTIIAELYKPSLINVATNNQEETVELQFPNNLEINATRKYSDTALIIYSHGGIDPVIEVLQQQNADINSMTNGGRSALILATWKGQKEVVNRLLQNTVISNDDRKTALFVAASYGNKDIIEILLQNNVDINSKTEYGETALIFASRIGQTQIVEVLVQNDADINESDRYGRTALMYAAWQVV